MTEPARQESVSPTDYLDYNYDRFYSDHDFGYVEQVEEAFLEVILRRMARLPAGASILDVGCGTGFDTWLMGRMGYRAVGVDTSPVAIEKARERTGQACFFCRDALTTQDQFGRPFDLIYCSGFMPFNWVSSLQDPAALTAARKLLEYLRPEGHLVFVWDSTLTGERWSPYPDVRPDRMWMNYTVSEVRELWEAAGACRVDYAGATHKRLASLLGRGAFGAPISLPLSAAARILRRPVQIVLLARRER